MPSAVHIKLFAKPMFEPNTLALQKSKSCPTAIINPPNKIQFLFPKNRSETKPPSMGVK